VDDATGGCVVPSSGKNQGLLSVNGVSPFVVTTSGDGTLAATTSDTAGTFPLLDGTSSGLKALLKLNDSNTIGALYPAISDRCSKKQWAQNNGVVWDGVTNYNAC
jgi:hypothetical protein